MLDRGCQLSNTDQALIAQKTEGWNCSDIRNLAEKATDFRMDEIEEKFGDLTVIPKDYKFRHLELGDFLKALECTKPSNNPEIMDHYVQWTSKHGSA